MTGQRLAVPVLETARLLLRPYEVDDLDAMAGMFADPDVTAHTLLGKRNREETAEVLKGYMSFLAERGYGMFAILDRETGDYLGECGLFVPPMPGPLALRYALVKSAWGKGYAPEASAAVIEDAFGRLALDELVAGVVPHNAPSIRVMEKLGFIYDRTITHGVEFNIFVMARDAWQGRTKR